MLANQYLKVSGIFGVFTHVFANFDSQGNNDCDRCHMFVLHNSSNKTRRDLELVDIFFSDDELQRDVPAVSLYFRDFLEFIRQANECGASPCHAAAHKTKTPVVIPATHADSVSSCVKGNKWCEHDINFPGFCEL